MPYRALCTFFLGFSALTLVSCGDIKLKPGTGLALNDPLPLGATLLSQGNIQAVRADVTISGTAQVYQGADGNALVRLTGFSTNASTPHLFVETPTSPIYYVTALRGISGQQNYSTGRAVAGQTFSRVVFRQSANSLSAEVGSVVLITPN